MQDLPTFTFILTSLELGLKSTDVAISTSCASAVDDLAAYYFKHFIQVRGSGSDEWRSDLSLVAPMQL